MDAGIRYVGQPGDSQAHLPRCDDFGHGRHADGVDAHPAQHSSLGGRLENRTHVAGVNAFLQRDAFGARGFAHGGSQFRIVGVAQIGETRSPDVAAWPARGGAKTEIDVIGDQHQVARPVLRIDPARRVCHKQDFASPQSNRAHRGDSFLGRTTFIQMTPAAQDQDAFAVGVPNNRAARVSGHARLRQSGDFCVFARRLDLKRIDKRAQTRSGDHRKLRRRAKFFGKRGRCLFNC